VGIPTDTVVIGKIVGVHGVKGWVKVYSYTEPMSNIFEYAECYLKRGQGVQAIEFDNGKRQGKGLIAHIKGVDDRDLAATYNQCDVLVAADALPALEQEDYYWHQLEGCAVFTAKQRLGVVTAMMATGANDVLCVKGDDSSIDRKERLIPWVPEQFVIKVDIVAKRIDVDWDPEF